MPISLVKQIEVAMLSHIRAKLPKSGKLEKLEKNYNFLKLVSIVVDFFHKL